MWSSRRALPKDQKPACLRTGSEHGFSGVVGRERKSVEALLERNAFRVCNRHGCLHSLNFVSKI